MSVGGVCSLARLILLLAVRQHSAYMVNVDAGKPLSDDFNPVQQPKFYSSEQSANVSRLLDSLLYGYDNRLRPNYKGPPVEVGITLHISTVSSISEVDMDFSVDFYFRQYWHDPRLRFDEEDEELCISNEMLNKIWWPDTFFANAKNAKFHFTTTKNAFLRIKPSGEIVQSLRLTVVAMCSMDLTFFPMDTQVCALEIESYGYSSKDINYTWKEGAIDSVSLDKLHLPQFEVKSYRTTERQVKLTTGNYSRLSCALLFKRSLGYYIIQIYVPSCLIVVLSWVSFWLSRDAVPARVALGITTVLTMTTLISSTNASLPKISYLKSIDVYLVTCFFMVFSSLVEFAAVSYIGDKRRRGCGGRGGGGDQRGMACFRDVTGGGKVTSSSSSPSSSVNNGPANRVTATGHLRTDDKAVTEVHISSAEQARAKIFCDQRQQSVETDESPTVQRPLWCPIIRETGIIDQYSRVIFPSTFLLFNLLYWSAYYNVSGRPDEPLFTVIR